MSLNFKNIPNNIKNKWRDAHLSKNHLKVNKYWRFDKSEKKFYNIKNVVPNLLVIGAQKCGTTSLCAYMDEHPDIYISSPEKEPGYFIFEEWAKSYWNSWGIQLKSKSELMLKLMIDDTYVGQEYFGDGSTHYTIANRVEDFNLVSKLKQKVGKPKIIYSIRNPFDRISSAYFHMKKFWNYKSSFDRFLVDDPGAIETTLYFKQIKSLIDEFEDDVFLILFEDFINSPQCTLDDIYSFLDLEPYNAYQDFKVHNKTRPRATFKISNNAYNTLIPLFDHEKEKIQDHFQIELNWDLAKETWVA